MCALAGVRALRFDGAFAPRLRKFDKAFQAVRVVVGGSAASMNKTVQPGFARWKTGKPPLRARKHHKTGPVAHGNAPLLPPAAASLPEGEILAALFY
jgi:hypothetical protein